MNYLFTSKLRLVLKEYMDRVPEWHDYCTRCLRTDRWSGNVILMIVDAAFTSIGLNYFVSVVPHVIEFEEEFVKTGLITNFESLVKMDIHKLQRIWKNRRSWFIAKKIAEQLNNEIRNTKYEIRNTKYEIRDTKRGTQNVERRTQNVERGTWNVERETMVKAFRSWAFRATLENWKEDSIGKINGVGINTYQYLRMMGGVDTVMPDKIVKRVINGILEESNQNIKYRTDEEFVYLVEDMAKFTGYRPIEITWMTWLVQSEGDKVRIDKYRTILPRI